jgi:hypothetical protein
MIPEMHNLKDLGIWMVCLGVGNVLALVAIVGSKFAYEVHKEYTRLAAVRASAELADQ